jgi:hypothetical protein
MAGEEAIRMLMSLAKNGSTTSFQSLADLCTTVAQELERRSASGVAPSDRRFENDTVEDLTVLACYLNLWMSVRATTSSRRRRPVTLQNVCHEVCNAVIDGTWSTGALLPLLALMQWECGNRLRGGQGILDGTDSKCVDVLDYVRFMCDKATCSKGVF